MKKLFSTLVVSMLMLGLCGFNPLNGTPCDHQHDNQCGYDVETNSGCTHIHENIAKPLDNHNGPAA